MRENLGKWPSKRGPISKITPSDGYGGDTVPLAVEWRYDFPEFGRHLGGMSDNKGLFRIAPPLDAQSRFAIGSSEAPAPLEGRRPISVE